MSSSSETLPVPQLIRVKGVTEMIVSESRRIQMGHLLSESRGESGGESGRCADFRATKAQGNPLSV